MVDWKEKYEKLEEDYTKLYSKYKELEARVRELEGMTDGELKEELLRWVEEHRGEIDVKKFSEIYKISVKRVEEGIEKLLKEGYLGKKYVRV